MMHEGFLYATQLEDSNLYASVGVIDIENGEEVKMYEEKDHRMAGHLHFLDDLMFFTSAPMDKEDNFDADLIVYDLNTDGKIWTTPVVGIYDQRPIDLGDHILLFNEYESRESREKRDDRLFDNDTAYIYDKESGEEKFNIVANATVQYPSINDEGVYFADHNENVIQLYDFDGNLKNELQPEIGFSLYQMIRPIATEEALIYADDEGIVWYDPDLSTMQHRVERGESTIRYMDATDDRVFAIISEKTDEGDDVFFNISLDIKTGEVYEKVALETNENTVLGLSQHVYNNQYHFAVMNEEDRKVYYVFSGDDVNKPIVE